jgi:hypothetical protein
MKIRVLHRNLLLLFYYLSVEEPLTDPARTMSRPVSQQQLRKTQNQSLPNPAASESENCETSTDNENRPDMIISVIPRNSKTAPLTKIEPEVFSTLQEQPCEQEVFPIPPEQPHKQEVLPIPPEQLHEPEDPPVPEVLPIPSSNHGKQERDNHQTG